MADLIRTTKSGSEWAANELTAYDIVVVSQSKFDTHHVPNPTTPSLAGFMTAESREAATDYKTWQLLHYLHLAMNPKVGLEPAVDNFAAEVLKALGYDEQKRIVFIRRIIPLLICGEYSVAQTDVCLMDDNDIILLLLAEDKTSPSPKNPEA